MDNKGKIFSLIALSGAMLFSFVIIGKNFDLLGANALLDTGELINDRIIFDGTGKTPTDAGEKVYLSETSTKRGTTIYLANKSAIKPTSGNVAAIRSMYESNKTFSEISFLDINNDKAENFYFQNIHSITLVADRNISSLQLDVYTAEIGQEFTKSGQIKVDEQSSDTGTFDFNNIEYFAIKIKQASEPLHNIFIKQVILDYTCDTDYVPGEKHSVFAAETTGGSINLGSYPRYKSGDTVNFTVNPDDGFDIGTVSTSPSISLSRTGNQYTFTMPNEDVTVTATFSKIPYSLTPDPLVENGQIIIDASTYYVDDNVEFSLNPDPGYCVESYSTTPSCAITEDGGVYSFTMPASDVVINASFGITYSLSVDPDIEHGSVSVDKSQCTAGTNVVVSVNPEQYYEISSVSYNGTPISPVNDVYSFVMPSENVTVSAQFITNYLHVDVDSNIEHGSVSVDKVLCLEGDTVTVTATPETGYELNTILVDGVEIEGTTFDMPNHDVEVSAIFSASSSSHHFEYDSGSVIGGTFDIEIRSNNTGTYTRLKNGKTQEFSWTLTGNVYTFTFVSQSGNYSDFSSYGIFNSEVSNNRATITYAGIKIEYLYSTYSYDTGISAYDVEFELVS